MCRVVLCWIGVDDGGGRGGGGAGTRAGEWGGGWGFGLAWFRFVLAWVGLVWVKVDGPLGPTRQGGDS